MLNKLSFNLASSLNESETEAYKIKSKVFTENSYLNENHINEEITVEEITRIHNAIENAIDEDEIQEIIYNISDGVLEDEVQRAFDQSIQDEDDLDTLKGFVITTLEDNAEYLDEAAPIDKKEKEDRLASVKTQLDKDGDQLADDEKEALNQEAADLEKELNEEEKIVWTSEVDTSEEAYNAAYEGWDDDEKPSYEDWLNSDFDAETDYIIQDLNEFVLPEIDKQVNDGLLFIVGNYNSNYPDFRPSGGGAVTLKGTEGLKNYLTKWDDIRITSENGELNIRAYDHDGSVSGTLCTVINDRNKILEELGYYKDYEDKNEAESEYENDLYYEGVDYKSFAEHPDLIIPIKNTITEAKENTCKEKLNEGRNLEDEFNALSKEEQEKYLELRPENGNDRVNPKIINDLAKKYNVDKDILYWVINIKGNIDESVEVDKDGNKTERDDKTGHVKKITVSKKTQDKMADEYNKKQELKEDTIPNSFNTPCPKCGSNNFVEIDDEEDSDGTQHFHLTCQDCGYTEENEYNPLEEDADEKEYKKRMNKTFKSFCNSMELNPNDLDDVLWALDELEGQFGDETGEYQELREYIYNELLNESKEIEENMEEVRKDSIEKGLLTETGEWDESDEDLLAWKEALRDAAEEIARNVDGEVKIVKGFDAYQGPFAIIATPKHGDIELWSGPEEDLLDAKVAHVGWIEGSIGDISLWLNKDEIPEEFIINESEDEEPKPRKLTREEWNKEFGPGANPDVINAGREPENRVELVEQDTNSEIYKAIEDTLDGTDFILGQVYPTYDNIIKFDVFAYDSEGKEMSREVELDIKDETYDSVKEAVEEWMQNHNSPDLFYESETDTINPNDLTKEQLWKLRQEIKLGSIYIDDYKNSYNINPKAVCDFFDSFIEDAQQDDEGNFNNRKIEEFDNAEELYDYYLSCENPFGNLTEELHEEEVKGLKTVKSQGNIFMLEDETKKIIVGENYNESEGLIENAEIYNNKEEADKDYLGRCDIIGGTQEDK